MSYSLPGSYVSIHKIDFRNLRLPVLDSNGRATGSMGFRNGQYEDHRPGQHYSERVTSIHFLGGSRSNQDYALVLYSWFGGGGSSSQGATALLFTVAGGHLRWVESIGWDTHFQTGQPTESFDSATNTLVVRSAHYIPGDAHCCVSAVDIVGFRWNGERFVEVAIDTKLSEYGKSLGKKLPGSKAAQ